MENFYNRKHSLLDIFIGGNMADSCKLCHTCNVGLELTEEIEVDAHLSETNYLNIWNFFLSGN